MCRPVHAPAWRNHLLLDDGIVDLCDSCGGHAETSNAGGRTNTMPMQQAKKQSDNEQKKIVVSTLHEYRCARGNRYGHGFKRKETCVNNLRVRTACKVFPFEKIYQPGKYSGVDKVQIYVGVSDQFQANKKQIRCEAGQWQWQGSWRAFFTCF